MAKAKRAPEYTYRYADCTGHRYRSRCPFCRRRETCREATPFGMVRVFRCGAIWSLDRRVVLPAGTAEDLV